MHSLRRQFPRVFFSAALEQVHHRACQRGVSDDANAIGREFGNQADALSTLQTDVPPESAGDVEMLHVVHANARHGHQRAHARADAALGQLNHAHVLTGERDARRDLRVLVHRARPASPSPADTPSHRSGRSRRRPAGAASPMVCTGERSVLHPRETWSMAPGTLPHAAGDARALEGRARGGGGRQ